MQLLHESTVLPDEIDSLGHMNVRYYIARMEAANQRLLNEVGAHKAASTRNQRVDTYTRFRHEQFEGATLHTYGGVLAITEGGLRSYVEIRNPETEQLAASFIVTTTPMDVESRAPLPLTSATVPTSLAIEIPDYAAPRTLELGPSKQNITLAELDNLIPEVDSGGMMSGKREATVEAGDIDGSGWLRADLELMFLPFAKLAAAEQGTQGPPVFTTPDGKRVGWAVMETRTQNFGQVQLGDELAYFSADIDLQAKSRISRRWAFNRHSGALLGLSDTVGVCIDLDARRAIPWPEDLRALIEEHMQPQLA